MAVSLSCFSRWLWSGNSEKVHVSNGSSVSSLKSSFDKDFGLRESETVKFPGKISSTKGNVKEKGKMQSFEEGMIDTEWDIVIEESDLCLSGYESDGPEWCIGWEEPHGHGFQVDHETVDGFAVLVPCYKPSCKELVEGSNHPLLTALRDIPNAFSSGKSSL